MKNSKKNEKKKIIIITGATGSGKSALAIEMAKKINGIIINADSMQVYKQIPILSAQPSNKDRQFAQHLMYGYKDILSFEPISNDSDMQNKQYQKHCNDRRYLIKPYSVGSYIKDLNETLLNISINYKDKTPIIVGGTMLYINAIINGLNAIPEINKEIRETVREKYKNKTVDEIFEDLVIIDGKYAKIVDKTNPHRLLRGIEVKLSTGKSITEFWSSSSLIPEDGNNKNTAIVNKNTTVTNSKKDISDIHNKNNIGINNDKNIFSNYSFKKYILEQPRNILYERINNRFDEMIKNGALDEVKKVIELCKQHEMKISDLPKAIGLNELADYINGKISLQTAIDKVKQMSRNYAKRQLTWFRNRFVDFKKIDSLTNINIIDN